jgi:hypothetical protein
MAILVIEIDPNVDSQQWRQDFDGTRYLCKFCYNSREELYNFELYDTDGDLIASNPLVLGQVLFSENPDPRLPAGSFFCADITNASQDANQTNLGRSTFLFYSEAAEE